MPEILIANAAALEKAAKQLASDPVLKPLIKRYGLCTIRPHKDYYRELVESIVGQQLSVKAAASINRRFVELFGGTFPEPSAILDKSVEELRTAGLSGAKANYVRDLALHVIDAKLEFERFDKLSNEEIMSELVAVKGIGEWTAHMFLMFCMGRLDILPVGDLGIRTGVMKLYGLSELPTPDKIREICVGFQWHPYESVASWYIWQSLDNEPKS
jgi:DNA-3-methyladenine glycosylase II